jgi:hypothetical protein
MNLSLIPNVHGVHAKKKQAIVCLFLNGLQAEEVLLAHYFIHYHSSTLRQWTLRNSRRAPTCYLPLICLHARHRHSE